MAHWLLAKCLQASTRLLCFHFKPETRRAAWQTGICGQEGNRHPPLAPLSKEGEVWFMTLTNDTEGRDWFSEKKTRQGGTLWRFLVQSRREFFLIFKGLGWRPGGKVDFFFLRPKDFCSHDFSTVWLHDQHPDLRNLQVCGGEELAFRDRLSTGAANHHLIFCWVSDLFCICLLQL